MKFIPRSPVLNSYLMPFVWRFFRVFNFSVRREFHNSGQKRFVGRMSFVNRRERAVQHERNFSGVLLKMASVPAVGNLMDPSLSDPRYQKPMFASWAKFITGVSAGSSRNRHCSGLILVMIFCFCKSTGAFLIITNGVFSFDFITTCAAREMSATATRVTFNLFLNKSFYSARL